MISEHQKRAGIQATIEALAAILATASARASAAQMAAGTPVALPEMNQAIGTLVGIETELESAVALYRAAIALHRS